MERRLIRPADLVLVLAAAALAAGLLLWQNSQSPGSCVAVIEKNGAEVICYPSGVGVSAMTIQDGCVVVITYVNY